MAEYHGGMSDKPLTRRRVLRTSLATVFIVVMLLALWMGYYVDWIRQRREFLAAREKEATEARVNGIWLNEVDAPTVLRWFGETGQTGITVLLSARDPEHLTPSDSELVAECRRLFPEAVVVPKYRQADGHYVSIVRSSLEEH